MTSCPQPRLESFYSVFEQELDVINARRRAVAEGKLAQDRGYEPEQVDLAETARARVQVRVQERVVDSPAGRIAKPDERDSPVPRPSEGHNLTGLALSGGGIRSASFCLGVLQGLDALREDKEPQVIDQIDYLSTVSGGGYIGTSLVAALMQAQGRFPFASKLDQEETIEVQHLRDHSNFLTPNGGIDILVGLVAVLRGLLINAVIFLGIILVLAGGTVLLDPTYHDLVTPFFLEEKRGTVFFWTAMTGALLLGLQPLYTIISTRLQKPRLTLDIRERLGLLLTLLFVAWFAIAFLELQTYILVGLFEVNLRNDLPADRGDAGSSNAVARALTSLGSTLPTLWTGLLSAGAALVVSAGKFQTVLRARTGDQSWSGSAKRWASLAGLYAVSAIVPLLFWLVYLTLSFWGIGPESESPPHPQAPDWLNQLAAFLPAPYPYALLYLILGFLLLTVSLLVRPNAGSLHSYYRDRLSRAFLWHRDDLERAVERWNWQPQRRRALSGAALAQPEAASSPTRIDVDTFKFTSLKKRAGDGWDLDVRFAPYLIVNTAVNLEASRFLNRRGRNADSFIFSPLFMGSEATGYIGSAHLEAVDDNVNLATAMAVSGAAASANMGASTIKPLTFSLSVLNIRLGYWLPNPRYVPLWTEVQARLASIGPLYFSKETFGLLDEGTRNVYLTDGGHFDNLGLYELLKRRCRFIIAVDAEADPAMNFDSLIRVQRYARIDLGIRINLPWDQIRQGSPSREDDTLEGPRDSAQTRGPHVAVGRIEYGERERGVLIYIKSSLSGDENDLIQDYKRRHTLFPHEATLDQFFSEEQFEVYRSLGFHVTKGFFTGRDAFAGLSPSEQPDWLTDLDEALAHLNVPATARSKIMDRA